MIIKKSIKNNFIISVCSIFLSFSYVTQAQEQKHSEGYIKTNDGLRLFYHVDGSGDDPVIVLHGGPGLSMSYLRPDLLRLSQNRTLIFYDQRGSGRSTVTSDPKLLSILTILK